MSQMKRFQAKMDLKLDCGHTIRAGESFVVTRFFRCEKDAELPLGILRTNQEAAGSQPKGETPQPNSNPKPVDPQ